jgi:hypothetical protein
METLDLGDSVEFLSGAVVDSGARWLTAAEITAIARHLQRQRDGFLAEFRQSKATRRAEKAEGEKRPSKHQITNLYSRPWFSLPVECMTRSPLR